VGLLLSGIVVGSHGIGLLTQHFGVRLRAGACGAD